MQRPGHSDALSSPVARPRPHALAAAPHGMAYRVHVSADRRIRRFTYVAETCPQLNGGVTVEAALADSEALYGLIDPEDRRRLHEAETEALESLQPFDVEARFLLPNGEQRWSRLTSLPRKLDDGSTVWEGFQIDITERRAAEEALRRSEARLSLAVEATGLGLWEYDIVADRLDWNPRLREMYGVGQDEAVSFETFSEAIHPEDQARVLGAYGAAVERGGDFSFEHRLLRPCGAVRWVLAHGRVLREGGRPVRALGTALDITDRKQAEADNLLLLDELNHRVKNSFATVASLLALRAKRARGEEARSQLTEALNQVMSIAQAYAHLYAGGQPRSLDVADYLRALCTGLGQGMTDGAVEVRVRAESAPMETDRALPLGMAVNELVTNAVKYAFPEGRRGTIEVGFEARDGGWRLSVADDGVGLPEDYGQRRGAGARLVRAFARQAGGRLRILDGPGARFEIVST